jgi:UDP-N-acetylmuramyl tripeptide synthase
MTLTVLISKAVIKLCRFFRLGGTTLPGKIALMLYPGIIRAIALNFSIIMVTGTNGKTTTTRIIGKMLSENGIRYITNKSGANLLSGVLTTFIEAVNLKGKSPASTALLEIDEAAFNLLSIHVEPDILVVTNFFRDQLDRFGELYSTLKGVSSGIGRFKKTKLVLNSDDSLCASLGKNTGLKTVYYGFAPDACGSIEDVVNSDAMFCLYCKTRYEYDFHIYGHLGGFHCPGCGYRRPDPQVTCTHVDELTSSSSQIHYGISDNIDEFPAPSEIYAAKINLPGLYNIYNSLAAVACGHLLGFDAESISRSLGSFECGFGRMETIETDGRIIKVILVKNPTGFNQVLNYLLTEDKSMQVAFLINDKLADGTDISWLWDVDFEKLQVIQNKADNIYTSGIRAEDMAVRLKYAGIEIQKISIEKDYGSLLDAGLSRTPPGHTFYILPTYTAMLEIRNLLKKRFKLKEFWK